jgi:hypothetical protein
LLSGCFASGVMLGRAVMLIWGLGEWLRFEQLKREGRRECCFVGVCGSAGLVVCGRLLPLLSSLSSFARQYCSRSIRGPDSSGGGDDRKSKSSQDVPTRKSSMFRPFDVTLVRDFDLDVTDSLPALDLLLLLFSFSRLATVSERFLGTIGAGEGLPGGEGKISLSARSG